MVRFKYCQPVKADQVASTATVACEAAEAQVDMETLRVAMELSAMMDHLHSAGPKAEEMEGL